MFTNPLLFLPSISLMKVWHLFCVSMLVVMSLVHSLGWSYSILIFVVILHVILVIRQQQLCNSIVITLTATANSQKFQCITNLGEFRQEANYLPPGEEFLIGVHYLSTTFLGQYEGYGNAHTLTTTNTYTTDVSLIAVPGTLPYTWIAFFYSFMPNCSTAYEYNIVVQCQ